MLFLWTVLLLSVILTSSLAVDIQRKQFSHVREISKGKINQIIEDDEFVYWPMPNVHDLYVVYDADYLDILLSSSSLQNRTIVAAVTYDVSLDAYLTLYLGYANHLFSSIFPSNELTFVVYQPTQIDFTQGAIFFLSLLPVKSIFLSFEHGLSSFGITSLTFVRKEYGLGPTIVYHLNHEKPWITNMTESNLDFTYSTTEQLKKAYQSHPLIFRNYYFSPLLSASSLYLPLNAPYYGFLINNSTSKFFHFTRIPASQREYLCVFRGRTNYSSEFYHENPASSSLDKSDRQYLFNLHHKGLLPQCQFSESNIERPGEKVSMVLPYTNYLTMVVQSAFVLCPGGNNPETFRLREVNAFLNFLSCSFS
jgi:hypothetical protein